MHIETHGNGPDLVLLHGWGMHGGIFAGLIDELSPHFSVHAVDLPGHGYSRDEHRFDADDCARRIADAIPRALWVGWSLGGLVALHAALAQPDHVRGLCMVASSPRFVVAEDWPQGVPAHVFAEFSSELRVHYRHAVERFLALETMGSAHAQSALRDLRKIVFERGEPDADALADALRALETTDLRARLSALGMPSLWIAGRRDRLVPPAAMQWAAANAAQARYLQFNSGHAPFLDHASAIADAIRALAVELPA